MIYLLDANVFIEAKDRNYGFDFCPAFWEWLIKPHAGARILSIKEVFDEIVGKEDELSDWVKDEGRLLFQESDQPDAEYFGKVVSWVNNHTQYRRPAAEAFFNGADYKLIAHALAKGYTVVTHEERAPQSKKSVKIPDVCDGIGVVCWDPFEMLRHEEAKFVPSPG
ncbi:MAG: DUF4411 family protein [Magnetococcales bacterium]|nr:DUF4411 family protein [Magnetococcales bacterium]